MISIIEAINDPNLFKPWFKKTASWKTWRVFLAALFALEMDAGQKQTFRECTKRNNIPTKAATEAWLICGRRSGKSFICSLIAVYIACFSDVREFLMRGESAVVMLIASDRRQARILMKYILALLNGIPLLKSMIIKEVADSVHLSNGVLIEIHTASFRSTRGYSILACLCDEIAFWQNEDASNPDIEIIDALRPGMSTIPNSKLLCLSSPYAKKGVLHDIFKRHYGMDNESTLVWKAATRTMNPSVPQRIIDAAIERDPDAAASEYGAEFRSDVSQFITREAIEAVTIKGRTELSPVVGVRYDAFVDPSGGSSDSFTLAICHTENNRKILDCVRAVSPPFAPDAVVKEFADLLRRYWLTTVTGDRYAGVWPESKFAEHRITYKTSQKTKGDLYRELLPLINSREVELLDNKQLFNQLMGLERKSGRSGADIIDHTYGMHDDIANAVAGAFTCSQQEKKAGVWGSTRRDVARLMQGTRFGRI